MELYKYFKKCCKNFVPTWVAFQESYPSVSDPLFQVAVALFSLRDLKQSNKVWVLFISANQRPLSVTDETSRGDSDGAILGILRLKILDLRFLSGRNSY